MFSLIWTARHAFESLYGSWPINSTSHCLYLFSLKQMKLFHIRATSRFTIYNAGGVYRKQHLMTICRIIKADLSLWIQTSDGVAHPSCFNQFYYAANIHKPRCFVAVKILWSVILVEVMCYACTVWLAKFATGGHLRQKLNLKMNNNSYKRWRRSRIIIERVTPTGRHKSKANERQQTHTHTRIQSEIIQVFGCSLRSKPCESTETTGKPKKREKKITGSK